MPDPMDFDNQADFMKACVPMMVDEGREQDQAVAACLSMWRNKGMKANAQKSVMSCADLCRACVAACIACMRVCMASKYANTAAAKACMEACHHCIAVCDLCAAVCESGTLAEIQKACQDCVKACSDCAKACRACAEACPDCKEACGYCSAICESCTGACKDVLGMDEGGDMGAMKFQVTRYFLAVKAVGDWELDVTAIPFGSRDSDGQWFDDRTDIMDEAFKTPLIVYQHGIAQGAKALDEKPVIVGRVVPGSLKKMLDGWHVRVILDKAVAQAKDIMNAARKGLAAVSSGSITHLARLDIGGKLIQYEKNRPGRIAIWPLGEISIWEKGNGNVSPANQFAVALPAMKAMYREAGVPFPANIDTHGVTEAREVRRRAKVKEAQAKAKSILNRLKVTETK